MNTIINDELPGNHDLRDQFFDMINDHDLSYKLPGHNPTLGELCDELGQIQQVYTHSFRTFTLDWAYRDSKPDSINSVASFNAWFAALDADMYAALSVLSEADVQKPQIDRGHGFIASPFVQFQVYREALLIFYAKASVYLRALEKPINDQWKAWVG